MEFDWKEFWETPEELIVGGLFGGAFIAFLHWWVFVTILACAFLWHLGGFRQGDKLFRRVGVPCVVGTFLIISGSLSLLVSLICAVCAFGVLSCGYGIPDATDEGSAIGRFWLSLLKVPNLADAATRATVGLLFGACWLPLAWVSLSSYLVAVLVLTVGYPLIEEYVE